MTRAVSSVAGDCSIWADDLTVLGAPNFCKIDGRVPSYSTTQKNHSKLSRNDLLNLHT
jgi:hypothetical protein